MNLKAPFPYFGGKSKAAELIWSRFGTDVGNYVEPFLGSAAVYLQRPKEFTGWATLNDLDGNVVNFWRSVRRFPLETAEAACQPVFEADLHARHLVIFEKKHLLTKRLCADPEYCEPLLAGWWAWGLRHSIAANWCANKGPWIRKTDEDGILILIKGDAGQGINCGQPSVHVKPFESKDLIPLLQKLCDSFRDARVTCGDWKRILGVSVITIQGPCAVLLDPPYSQTGAVYAQDSNTVAHEVRAWCVANGSNPLLRIALCGHDGEHNELESLGWSVETWDKPAGYQGADDRERIWFSPACNQSVDPRQTSFF